jgi:hypothetical protein
MGPLRGEAAMTVFGGMRLRSVGRNSPVGRIAPATCSVGANWAPAANCTVRGSPAQYAQWAIAPYAQYVVSALEPR